MNFIEMDQEMPAYLVLENGTVFEGKAVRRAPGRSPAEVVFTTGMTGYLETLTDPSYYGQIVAQTVPADRELRRDSRGF